MVDGGVLSVVGLAVPFVGAALIPLAHRRPNLREGITLLTALTLLACVLGLYQQVSAGARPAWMLLEVLPGVPLALEVEPLGMLFALVASFLWLVTSIYAIGYMRGHGEPNQTRFYVWFAVAIGSTTGIAFAANLFTLFVFYEVLTLSTYPLVTHTGTAEAKRAGRVYLGLLVGSSMGFLLIAILWTWHLSGSLDFRLGGVFDHPPQGPVLALLLGLYVLGIGKAAVMPLHRWLPAAMVAPTPVSALLHAVAVVKAGVFSILKVVVYVFGTDTLAGTGAAEGFVWLAAFTVLVASLVAMGQDNLKLRLAYSTVSQLGYVVLGALCANPWGVLGGGMQIVTHAFAKITLFFCAGAVLVAAHKTRVSELDGLGRQMPVTMAAFAIGSLSIIGLPPFGGMWSKWYLALATLEAGHLALLATLMVSSLLSVVYLLAVPVRGFFKSPAGDGPTESAGAVKEAPWPCVLAIVVAATGAVALFAFPAPVYELIRQLAPLPAMPGQ